MRKTLRVTVLVNWYYQVHKYQLLYIVDDDETITNLTKIVTLNVFASFTGCTCGSDP